MAQSEIDAVRALLSSKPRPVGWAARRQRIEEIGQLHTVTHDDLGATLGQIFPHEERVFCIEEDSNRIRSCHETVG